MEIIVAIAIPLIIALIIWIAKIVGGKIAKHKKHHEQLEEYPSLFNEHNKIHAKISTVLSNLSDANVTQMRSQMLHIYDDAIKEGEISLYWYHQFFDLHASYKKMNGNGFIDEIAEKMKDVKIKE